MLARSAFFRSTARGVARTATALFFLLRVTACPAAPALPVPTANENPTGAHARPAEALRDQRLDGSEPVFGVIVGDEPRAYTVADLRRATPLVHDLVEGRRIDVKFENGQPTIVRGSAAVRSLGVTNWASWIQAHPETSLWRRAASAEAGEPREPDAVRVLESRDYRTVLGCAFGCEAVSGELSSTPAEHPGVFVISGFVENASASPVHHVVLRYELLDDAGKVVYRDEGFNRSAEVLAETEASAPSTVPAIVPIAPGARDTFRMIFLNEELPRFRRTRVTVGRTYDIPPP